MMAWQAFLDGKFDDSLQLYAQAEELEPREAKMKYQIGLVLLKSSRYEEAIARFKQAIDIEPLHAEAIQALILTFLEKGKASEAIPFAERAVWATQSQDVNTLAMLGEVYRAAGDSKKAIQAFQSAIQFAASQDPSLVPRIQQELNSLRPQRMMNQ
jgi:tetratricopeptide (TPR) repeat protein